MISLVIPAFNRADLIAQTIQSALAQSVAFSEIIVVDDGSTDHTAAVLASFGDQLRVIRTPNAGVQAARNTGVAAADFEYVTLCDSDDLLLPTFVEVMGAWMRAHTHIDIAYSNFCTFNADTVDTDKFAQAPEGWFHGAQSEVQCDGAAEPGDKLQAGFCWAIPNLYSRTVAFQPLFPTGATFKKSFYQKIGGFDTQFNGVGGEDWEFTLRAIASGQVALCRQPLARVRKHAGNDSTNLVRQLLGESKILIHALATHKVTADDVPLLQTSIDHRYLSAFDHAYATGEFSQAKKILPLLPKSGQSPKLMLKKLITVLPAALRTPLWRATQRSQ